MSRSNNTDLINPAVKFFDWSGGEGHLRYFDKSLGEKGENVTVELPFRFLILDRVYQVTGGIDDNSGYIGFWSNAIKNLKTQKLVVRSKRGVEVQGIYEHIKGHPGVKFMQGLYVAFKDGDSDELQIGYLKLKGAALSSWFDFTKAHRNIYEGAFAITLASPRKKGTNTYYEPVFEHIANVSDESAARAKALDEMQLQPYLTSYFAQAGIAEVELEYSGQAMAAAAGSSFYDNEPPMPIGDDHEPSDEPFVDQF